MVDVRQKRRRLAATRGVVTGRGEAGISTERSDQTVTAIWIVRGGMGGIRERSRGIGFPSGISTHGRN